MEGAKISYFNINWKLIVAKNLQCRKNPTEMALVGFQLTHLPVTLKIPHSRIVCVSLSLTQQLQ